MKPEELQKNIALYYSKLPANAQQMFSSMEWLEKLKKMSIKYALNEEQSKTLASETVLVLLGMVHMMDYEQNLTKELKMPEETVENMLQDIRNSILRPVIMEITETYEKNSKEGVAEDPSEIEALEAKLDERFQGLSEDTRNAIVESKYYDNLYKIANKYELRINQIGLLEEITTDVMIGKVKTDDYENILKDKLGLKGDVALRLVEDINDQILKFIREKLISKTKPPITSIKLDKIEESELKRSEEFILSKAGIKINIAKLDPLELPAGKAPEKIKIPLIKALPTTPKLGSPAPTKQKPPLDLAQKFQTGTQTKVETTDHTLQSSAKISANPTNKNIDPYREIPG